MNKHDDYPIHIEPDGAVLNVAGRRYNFGGNCDNVAAAVALEAVRFALERDWHGFRGFEARAKRSGRTPTSRFSSDHPNAQDVPRATLTATFHADERGKYLDLREPNRHVRIYEKGEANDIEVDHGTTLDDALHIIGRFRGLLVDAEAVVRDVRDGGR